MDKAGKILVMDDEQSLREMIKKMLEHFGYEAEICADGTEAVKLFKSALKTKPFDMIIVDLTIPGGMGGLETIENIKKFEPELKAIVMSGHLIESLSEEDENKGYKAMIEKPFKMYELVNSIEKVMSS